MLQETAQWIESLLTRWHIGPVTGILIGQSVVAWGLIINHFANEKWSKYLTLFVVAPLSVIPLSAYYLTRVESGDRQADTLQQSLDALDQQVGRLIGQARQISGTLSTLQGTVGDLQTKVLQPLQNMADQTEDAQQKLGAVVNALEPLRKSVESTKRATDQLTGKIGDLTSEQDRAKGSIEESMRWLAATIAAKKNGYIKYLELFPNGQYKEEARERINHIDDQGFELGMDGKRDCYKLPSAGPQDLDVGQEFCKQANGGWATVPISFGAN